MSRDGQGQLHKSPYRLSHSAKNKLDYTCILDQLNQRLKHLGDRVLSKQPYLLSVPSDVPYRHSSRFVNTWHIGTPFAPEEEQLQYMSFLAHQDEGEELLHVDGGWSDDKGLPIEVQESVRVVPTSGRNTPLDAQRKRITLNDYKSKGKGFPDPTIKAEQPRNLDRQSEKINSIPQADDKQMELITADSTGAAVSQGGKRPREEPPPPISSLDGPSCPREEVLVAGEDLPRPEKRQKTTPTESDVGLKNATKPDEDDVPMLEDLPGLLSPTLPSSDEERGLPQLVSPTLPPSVSMFLSSHAVALEGSSDHYRTDPVRSILASAGLGIGLSPVPGNKKTAGLESQAGNRIRSGSQHSVRSTHSTASGDLRGVSPGLTPNKSGTPSLNGARASPRPRQRHIIVLKYGKKNRKRIEALLKFAARPKKNVPQIVPVAKIIPTSVEVKARASDESILNKKRPLPESPGLPPKKHKPLPSTSAVLEKPSTPVPSALKSPLIQPSSAQQKSAFSTPKKELKSSAMQRIASSDGLDARTPTNDRVRLSTPLSVERSSSIAKVSPQPTSAPANRDDERAAWHNLNSKYFALGRAIKREATSVGQAGDPSTKESATSVVLLIEGLLCFMINLTTLSYSQHNSDPGWATILPYHIFVFRASRAFPHLHGLVVQLGGVCRQYLHKYNMDRLARDPLPDEQVGSAPTPGSDGNTKTSEDGDKYKKKYLEFRDELVSNSRELQTAWLTGSRELSLDVLEREYPKTWKKRARDSSSRGVGRPTPSKITEEYWLPLDANASTFEAMRFAVAFLGEWCDREGVEWRCRIDL